MLKTLYKDGWHQTLKLAALGLSVSLAGCSTWPAPHGGGLADIEASADYYTAAIDAESSQGRLLTQLEILDAQLDVLVVQGARHCIPGRIFGLSTLSKRIRRELASQLETDAGLNLVVYQNELRKVKSAFWYVASKTACHSAGDSHNGEVIKEAFEKGQQPVILSIYFDTDSFVVGPGYDYQLQWLVESVNAAKTEIVLIGHADNDGDEGENIKLSERRAQSVAKKLAELGMDIANITVVSEGESKPVVRDTFAFNRRVDVLIRQTHIAQSPQLETIADSKTMTLKEWERVLAQPGKTSMVFNHE